MTDMTESLMMCLALVGLVIFAFIIKYFKFFLWEITNLKNKGEEVKIPIPTKCNERKKVQMKISWKAFLFEFIILMVLGSLLKARIISIVEFIGFLVLSGGYFWGRSWKRWWLPGAIVIVIGIILQRAVSFYVSSNYIH